MIRRERDGPPSLRVERGMVKAVVHDAPLPTHVPAPAQPQQHLEVAPVRDRGAVGAVGTVAVGSLQLGALVLAVLLSSVVVRGLPAHLDGRGAPPRLVVAAPLADQGRRGSGAAVHDLTHDAVGMGAARVGEGGGAEGRATVRGEEGVAVGGGRVGGVVRRGRVPAVVVPRAANHSRVQNHA